MDQQISLFDPVGSVGPVGLPATPEQVRDEALARVAESHRVWILCYAMGAIARALAASPDGRITTDDVWRELEVQPPEPRAMGAAMMRAKRAGWLRATPEYRKSTRVECHARPVRVWAAK